MKKIIVKKILNFVEEDLGFEDVTTDAIIPNDLKIEGILVSKNEGILAGISYVKAFLEYMEFEVKSNFEDGARLKNGDIILELSGNARDILKVERTVLNILMHMSGIATKTKKFQNICSKHSVKIAATRKITPSFAYFQKKAVEIGGGETHRFRLEDCILIKENHIKITGLEKAMKMAKSGSTRISVIR